MRETLQLTIKPSILSRARKLVIDKDFIDFDSEYVGEPPIRTLKPDITAFRFRVKWIRGYTFIIGRIFCIDIKTSNTVIKIRLSSLYGIRKKQLTEKYTKVLTALYDNFFDDISGKYLNQFNKEKTLRLSGIDISAEGITLNSKSAVIPWEDVGTKAYRTYYAIFSKSNPNKYKAFDYWHDWNTFVLYSVSRSIMKEKGYWSE